MKEYCCSVFKKMIDDEEILFDWPSGYKFGYFDSYHDYPINYCPNCGKRLDGEKSKVKIELDTLHYREKRLDKFVNDILNPQYKILDIYKSFDIYLVLIETDDDGDKIARHLQNYDEIRAAYDKRHESWSLN